MKISLTRNQREHRVETANPPAGAVSWGAPFAAGTSRSRGFTMMEIAISLAIIGIALVAIIGVLPIGMNAQQDIRHGALGANELTNYVYAITNYWVQYNANGSLGLTGVNGYTYAAASVPNT